jgi:hypothetical protein
MSACLPAGVPFECVCPASFGASCRPARPCCGPMRKPSFCARLPQKSAGRAGPETPVRTSAILVALAVFRRRRRLFLLMVAGLGLLHAPLRSLPALGLSLAPGRLGRRPCKLLPFAGLDRLVAPGPVVRARLRRDRPLGIAYAVARWRRGFSTDSCRRRRPASRKSTCRERGTATVRWKGPAAAGALP